MVSNLNFKMPYLSFSTYCRGQCTSSNKEERENHDKLLKSRQKYEKLLEVYKEENAVIHGSSTLDESYYHFASDQESALDKSERNETQVVTTYLIPDGIDKLHFWPLLRVNQLWIWVIDNSMLYAFLR